MWWRDLQRTGAGAPPGGAPRRRSRPGNWFSGRRARQARAQPAPQPPAGAGPPMGRKAQLGPGQRPPTRDSPTAGRPRRTGGKRPPSVPAPRRTAPPENLDAPCRSPPLSSGPLRPASALLQVLLQLRTAGSWPRWGTGCSHRSSAACSAPSGCPQVHQGDLLPVRRQRPVRACGRGRRSPPPAPPGWSRARWMTRSGTPASLATSMP